MEFPHFSVEFDRTSNALLIQQSSGTWGRQQTYAVSRGSVYDRAETDDVADPGLRWRGGALLSHGAGQPDKREGDGGAVAASSGSASHTHGNLGCVRAAAVESDRKSTRLNSSH